MAEPAATPPATKSDWPAQVADTVESVVGTIRDKTTVPVETVARALVYGLIVGVLALTALVLLVIALVRLGDTLVPGPVWAIDVGLGGLFVGVGLLVWRKRRPPAS